MDTLDRILQESAKRHRHLCPRQVLGARMALYAAELLGLELPRADKRLLVIAETDGCAVDGLIAATGCRVGSRTLRILDFGKVAATFTDTRTGRSVRVRPSNECRTRARGCIPNARNRWEAMLLGYRIMPAEELFASQFVRLNAPLDELLGRRGRKTICDACGEEIINGRETERGGAILCLACAGERYYEGLCSSPAAS